MPYLAHNDTGPASPGGSAEEADAVDEAIRSLSPPVPKGTAEHSGSQLPKVRSTPRGTISALGGGVPSRVVTEPGAAGQPVSVVAETVPVVWSDGSSEEGATDSRTPGQRRASELKAQIQACRREQRRLRAEYDVEVQHCADLRDALEARERELANSKVPLQTQLLEAREALEQTDRNESGALMRIEDDFAQLMRLVDSKDREIHEWDRRLHQVQQEYQRFLRDGPPKDIVVEEALRAVDKETSELLSGVQHREHLIACLNYDVRSSLEYMITANIEALGGPTPDLGLEDFLPGTVRDHLGLSEHGTTHLQILYKKYELIMTELRQRAPSSGMQIREGIVSGFSDQSTAASGRDVAAHTHSRKNMDVDSSRRSSQATEHSSEITAKGGPDTPLDSRLEEVTPTPTVPTLAGGLLPDGAQAAGEALAQMMPVLGDLWARPEEAEISRVSVAPVVPLVAMKLREEDDTWGMAEEELCLSSKNPAGRAVPRGAPPSASLEEESRILREAMAQELRQLAEALAPPDDGGAPHAEVTARVRAGMELRRAAAQGDVKAVKVWLPQATSTSRDDHVFLGWTVWHVAAAYGQCGVLECLKEDMLRRATHHLTALDCRTHIGLPALGVACLTGRVEAARSLILGMAPVDVQDSRGNTPLLWAVIGGQARVLVPMLLDVRADPEVSNCSGQRPDISGLLSGCSMATLTRPDLGTAVAAGPARAGAETASGPPPRHGGAVQELPSDRFGEAYHCIRTIGAEPPEEPGLLSYTLGMLKAPVRDSIGFGQNTKAKQLAQLSAEEADLGVWSEWVSNYTHAGLHAAVEVGRQNADPLLAHRNRQAMVLTAERLLLFNAKNWSLVQVIALSELSELTISSFSSSVLILRMHRLPDVVLDVAVSARGRLLDEVQLAVGTVAAKWGGADFGGDVRIRHESEPIVELLDERRKRTGTLAFIEAHIFLLLPYAPTSLLLMGGDTFFFGLLDVHQSSTAARGTLGGSAGLGWKWQTYFFILKSGSGEGRKLLWCQHPNDERCLGSVHVGRLLAVQPLDTPQGEACLIIDYGADERARALTLRASSAQNREDWIVAIRTMQTGV